MKSIGRVLKNFVKGSIKGAIELVPIIAVIWVLNYLFAFIVKLGDFLTKFFLLKKIFPYTFHIVNVLISIILLMLIFYGTHLLTKYGIITIYKGILERFVLRFPFVGKIYHSVKNSVELIKQNKDNISIIVLVDCKEFYSIGIVNYCEDIFKKNYVPVYIPGAPVVTGGSLQIIHKKKIYILDTTTEDIFKFQFSLGLHRPQSLDSYIKEKKKLKTLDSYIKQKIQEGKKII